MGFATTAQQVGLMFGFILLGLFGAKKTWISKETVSGLTNILVYFVTPGVIIHAFYRPFSLSQLHDMGITALVDALLFPAMMLLVYVLYARVKDPDRRRTLRFGGIYSNAGYLGIPLVQALFGAEGVFFAVWYVVAYNIYVWTQGWSMFPAGRGGLKQLLSNPAIPSVVVGLGLFASSWTLPGVVVTGLTYLSEMNAPLSMFVVGASLAGVAWRTVATDPWVWVGTAVRNVLIPALGVLVLWAVPLPVTARLATLILLSAPVAAFLVMFTVMHHEDTDFPSRLVTLSTLVSIATLPGTVALAQALW